MTRVVNMRRDPYDVYIGRPSKWGNPWKIGVHGNRDDVIREYRRWLLRTSRGRVLCEEAKRELRGKVLGCYCAPLPCHGDVLAEVADA